MKLGTYYSFLLQEIKPTKMFNLRQLRLIFTVSLLPQHKSSQEFMLWN